MTVIYEPKGRAKEYCDLAVNLYKGCGHGCKYCYAPAATRTDREQFYRNPEPRKEVIEKLSKQLKKQSFKGPVLLCFTSDPYQPINEEYDLTGQAIRHLKANNVLIEVLTKGGRRAEKDLHRLGTRDKIGCTLTFINNQDSLEWEPGAALPAERFSLLKKAKESGVKTWVSLEPVIDPEQSLKIIEETHEYIDLFKIGKLNHHEMAKGIDWSKFANQALEMFNRYNCDYYIKKDLKEYLYEPEATR